MRILGIDCGSERTGFGVIESDGRTHRLIAADVIVTSPKKPLSERLLAIATGLREAISKHQPEMAAIEGVFHAVNTQTAIKLAHVRGVAMLAIAEASLPVGEYSPMEVKTSVVGYGRGALISFVSGFGLPKNLRRRSGQNSFSTWERASVPTCHSSLR